MTAWILLAALAGQEDDALAAFKKDYASAKVEDRAAAVKTLGATHGEKVLRRLAELLAADEPPVRIEAAKALGGFQEKEYAARATAALVAALAANKDENVLARIYRSVGELKEESAAAVVNRRLDDRETAIAEAAVEAAGSIRSRTSIEPLIDLLLKVEREANLGRNAGKQAGLDRNVPASGRKDEKERARKLKSAAIKALQSITKEKFTVGKDWSEWWKKNSATFKVEK